MSRKPDPDTSPLVAAADSEPPALLRARTLARAAEAWAEPARPDPWRRVWESRPLRLAWATAVVALVAANLALPSRPSATGPAVRGDALTQAAADRELREVVALPRLKPEYADAGSPARPSARSEALPSKSQPSNMESRS